MEMQEYAECAGTLVAKLRLPVAASSIGLIYEERQQLLAGAKAED